MKGRLFTILVFSGNVAFATGFPTPAEYECCKAFLDGEDQTQECAVRLQAITPDGRPFQERCGRIVEALDKTITEQKRLSDAWPGTVSDVRIGNVTTDIQTSETGQPLTVILKYEVTVEENWRGNPYPRSLRWADRSIRDELNYSSRELAVIEGKVMPEPVLLNRQIPYIYSTFGFEKGNTYLYEIEFSPSFLTGFRKPVSANLPSQWTPSPCLYGTKIIGRAGPFGPDPFRRDPDPKAGEKAINAMLAGKDPSYELAINLEDHRGGKVRFEQPIEILPLGEFYKGHKEAGTPECGSSGSE